MKNKLLSALLVLSILLASAIGLVSCVARNSPTKLSTPTVALLDDRIGVAEWTIDIAAIEYELMINNVKSVVDNGTRQVTLSSGDTLKVRAIGDGKYYLTSDWSNAVTYSATVDNGGGTHTGGNCNGTHTDGDDDGICDACYESVIVVVDFYAINDLHGKFCDTDEQPGVDELSTYLKNKEITDDNVVILSSGDMWQGSAESNLTYGKIITEWMNEIGVVSMTLGNHEFDWGENYISENLGIAKFPFLAINVYDRATNQLADYCAPSIMINEGGIQIGIIGAIGNCYSSISSDMVNGVYFKTGSELAALVMAESNRLRDAGADLIVYSLHDGYGGYSNSLTDISSSAISSYYEPSLSNGYIDLVFEGHTHQGYALTDEYGVYHMQNGGENAGIAHIEIEINSVTGTLSVSEAEVVRSYIYAAFADDPATEAIEDKYQDIIDKAYQVLGTNSSYMSDSALEDLAAKLYYEAGVEKWGDRYDIALGGGFLRTRNPYVLEQGEVAYADLMSLFPFNNRLVLCSISGSDLKSKFIETSNDDYHIYPINPAGIVSSKTYYVVVDTYTSSYSRNNLTVIEYYDDTTYARDFIAEYIRNGGLL